MGRLGRFLVAVALLLIVGVCGAVVLFRMQLPDNAEPREREQAAGTAPAPREEDPASPPSAPTPSPSPDPGTFDVEKWLSTAEEVMENTESYTAVFYKQERVKGKLLEEETISLKFMKPFNVYMKWIEDPLKGREALYVKGSNNDRVKAHEGSGFTSLFTVNYAPTHKMLMKGNRHPVTDSGLAFLLKLIGENMRKGIEAGDLEIRELEDEVVYGRDTTTLEGIFPKDKASEYYCRRIVINIDTETSLPVRVQIYDGDDNLIEKYGYKDVDLRAGLTDADFDPENKEYDF